jgi:hypothetical protein
MSELWTGGCLCGARRYEFVGDPPHSRYCHCNMCKRATGGAFAVLVQARRDQLKWTQRVTLRVPVVSHRDARVLPECGTPLYLQYDGDDLIRVTAGSLDRPEYVRPNGYYGVESRLP